jgi:hypothetical protein
MINEVYQTVQTILNKENSGYVSPTEFNQLAKQVQDEIFAGYFEDINRDQNRENKGLTNIGYGNLAENQRQKLSPFITSATVSISGGVFPLPANVYYVEQDGVIDENGRVVDKVEASKSGYLSRSTFGSSEIFPTYQRIGSSLKVLPASLTGDLTVNYVRHPEDPKWTYTVVSSEEQFNASAADYQDFELQEIEFPNIVLRMLSYFGINLREGEVIQVAEALKNQQTVKETN